MDNWTNAKLCDVANLILGAILFFSPWMFGFDAGAASQNAYVAGVVIAILAIAALAAFAVWEEWLNLIVGLWTLVAPWVLGSRTGLRRRAGRPLSGWPDGTAAREDCKRRVARPGLF